MHEKDPLNGIWFFNGREKNQWEGEVEGGTKKNRLKKDRTRLPTPPLGVEIRSRDALIMRFLCYDLHINFLKIGYLFPN